MTAVRLAFLGLQIEERRLYLSQAALGRAVQVPIMEKAYAFYRSGAGTYKSLDWGWTGSVFSDLGVSNTTFSPQSTDANSLYSSVSSALSGGRAIAIQSASSISGAPVIASHVYSMAGTNRDASGNVTFTLRNPWGYDGAGNDGNTGDGLITLTFGQLQTNFSSGAMAV